MGDTANQFSRLSIRGSPMILRLNNKQRCFQHISVPGTCWFFLLFFYGTTPAKYIQALLALALCYEVDYKSLAYQCQITEDTRLCLNRASVQALQHSRDAAISSDNP